MEISRSRATLTGDAENPVVARLDVLAGHQPQQLGGLSQRPVQVVAIQGAQRGVGVAHQRIDQCFDGLSGSSQSHGGLPTVA